MSKLITAKINCSKIDKTRLFTGKKGIYLDLAIWINDQPDQFGNDVSIQQRTNEGEDKIYLGNGRVFKKESEIPSVSQSQPQTQSTEPPEPVNEYDDLPF